MAKWLAKAGLYVGGHLLAPGMPFESDAVPGKNWEPLDDEAKAAYRARFRPAPVAAPPDPEPEKPKVVVDASAPIPDGWMDLPSKDVIALSRQLGAPGNNRYAQAIVFIEKVIAGRGQGEQQ